MRLFSLGREAVRPMTSTAPTRDRSDELYELMSGFALAAGGANVIMQLAHLPVGRGVAESRVESGRVDRHPIKRLRTTTAYLVIALFGTEEERSELRRQIDRQHAQVVSRPDDAVAYRAFDPELQLWVGACLYKGVEDVHAALWGAPSRELIDDLLYPVGARLATTLQVSEERWPEDRDAFEVYWLRGLARIEMDDVTRTYLRGIADQSLLLARLGPAGAPLKLVLRHGLMRLFTVGFLPEPFRAELGVTWTPRMQRRFDRAVRTAAAVNRRLPGPVRRFPLNAYLWDARRRLRRGVPVV